MSAFRQIASALRQGIERPLATALPSGARVYWPNAPLPADWDATSNGPWAGVSYSFGGGEILTVGRPAQVRYRGSLEALLAWPREAGEGPLLAGADMLADALQGQKLGAIRLGQPALEPEGFAEEWFTSRFAIDWTAVDGHGADAAVLDLQEGTWGSGSSAIRQALSAVVASIGGLTVQHWNAPMDLMESPDIRVFTVVLTGAQLANQATEGTDATKVGIYQAQIVAPAGEGDSRSLSVADQIADRLSLARSSRLELGAASIVEQGRLGGSWVTTLHLPFQILTPA